MSSPRPRSRPTRPGRAGASAAASGAGRTEATEAGRGVGSGWANGVRTSTVAPAPNPGWAFHRNLADHLLLGEPLAVRPEESRDVVAVLEAGHRSGANGGELVEIG